MKQTHTVESDAKQQPMKLSIQQRDANMEMIDYVIIKLQKVKQFPSTYVIFCFWYRASNHFCRCLKKCNPLNAC